MEHTDLILDILFNVPMISRMFKDRQSDIAVMKAKCSHRLSATTADEIIPFWKECWDADCLGMDWVDWKISKEVSSMDEKVLSRYKNKLRDWNLFDFLFDEQKFLRTGDPESAWKIINLRGLASSYNQTGRVDLSHRRGLSRYYWIDLTTRSYQAFLGSHYWATVREQVKQRDDGKCCMCGCQKKDIQVHHKTYEFRGREHLHLDTLETICLECHKQHHEERGDKLRTEEDNQYYRYAHVHHIE